MKKVWIFFLLLFVSFAAISPCFSQSDQVKPSSALTKLNAEIIKLKVDPELQHASWGLCVLSSKSGEVITEYNSHVSLIPASTLKIVTTAAALSLLDSSFQYETKLQYDGQFDSITGTLKGNIFIKGGGDPSLESELFPTKKDSLGIIDQWVKIIKQKGIKKIEGAVIADATIFEDELIPSEWIWGDMGNYYGAGSCGLSFRDNKYEIFLKSGNLVGDSTWIIRTEPEIPGLEFVNGIKAGGNGDNGYIYGSPYTNLRFLSGTIPQGKEKFSIEGSIPDPAWFCAYTLETNLRNNGIAVIGSPTTIRALKINKKYSSKNRTLLHTHYSPNLSKIVYFTNLKSNNLYAEHLLKTIGFKQGGIGNDTTGINAVEKFWASKGIDIKGLYMADGCGLSRMNTITTRQQAEILKVMTKETVFKPFFNSLPIAGKTGSLSSLGIGTFAENNLRAKSGYLTRARGYTGYVTNKSGEQLIFSILANNYECSPAKMKKKIEKLMVLISDLE